MTVDILAGIALLLAVAAAVVAAVELLRARAGGES